jgi:hypothetical protein
LIRAASSVVIPGLLHRAEAIAALLDAWREHAKQTGADPTYLTADDINVVDGQRGQALRDGSPYPRRKWSPAPVASPPAD